MWRTREKMVASPTYSFPRLLQNKNTGFKSDYKLQHLVAGLSFSAESLQLCLPNQVQDRIPKDSTLKARPIKVGVAEVTLGMKLSGQEGGIWPSKTDACPASGYELTVTWAALHIASLSYEMAALEAGW